MKVLVTFAVETEFAPWKKALKLRARVADSITIHQSEIGGVNVDFVVTGMGAENASHCAEILMRKSYDLVIAAGFAGALRSELSVGDIVVASAVQHQAPAVQHQSPEAPASGTNRLLGNPQTIISDADLMALAAANGAKIVEALISVDKIAATAEEKSRLAPLANAADMESFAILSAARARAIPAVAVRVISDGLRQNLPEGVSALVDDTGAVNVPGVAKYVVSHPLAVPAVIRLGRRSKSAAETLKRFLESYIRGLSLASDTQPREELQGVAAR
jgi:adenosylhomocysteine nucleosidase